MVSAFLFALSACQPEGETPQASYVGGASCISCHDSEYASWSGSHHDYAMQVASDTSVLGNFENTQFVATDIEARFTKRDDEFYVTTEGSSGQIEQFRIAYTFGITPLQQYLIEQPGGRLQALRIAWDSRPDEEGGGRWFSLYPDETITAGDPLHWTGPNQNWNYMCADCHSTNVEKRYDIQSNTYETSWSDLNVSCESCHGPGSGHVDWASEFDPDRIPSQTDDHETMGFDFRLRDASTGDWRMNPATGISELKSPPPGSSLIDTCARCHARRTQIGEGFTPGDELLDYYRPALLREELYFPDGQINDEVYVYGSFLQSKMFAAGVTCTNCHDAHSLKLKATGNALCISCHLPEKFDAPSHSGHDASSEGGQCISCHMPSKYYMEVDKRRDHSFKVPTPEISESIGAPDPCTTCHENQTARWAQQSIEEWRDTSNTGSSPLEDTPASLILHQGRSLAAGMDPELERIASDPTIPAITRATAIELLADYGSVFSARATSAALRDQDPLVRLAAVSAAERADPATRQEWVLPLLSDPIRAVRLEAARVLAPTEISGNNEALLESVISELIEAEHTNADRPQAHVNIGLVHLARGRMEEAENAFRTSIRVDSTYIPGRVNLSDVYRLTGQDALGERVLREAISITPSSAEAHYALGLNLIRQERRTDAIDFLANASRLGTYNPRFSYVYAVALHSTGEIESAIETLENTHALFPRNVDVLSALSTMARDINDLEKAKMYANRLVAVDPGNAAARQLLNQLNE